VIIGRGYRNDEVGHEDGAEANSCEHGSPEETADEPTCSKPLKRKRSVPSRKTNADVGTTVRNQDQASRQKRPKSNRSPATGNPAVDSHPTTCAVAENAPKEPAVIQRKWKWQNVKTTQPEWNGTRPDFLKMDMTPCFIFERCWDDEVIEHTVSMTNMYAAQKVFANVHVHSDELRGVLISSYVSLPSRRIFWEQFCDIANSAVSSIMSLNRFEEILRYLHFADNLNLSPGDKMAKVRPLFDMMNERYIQFWPVEQDLDVDKAMIPYFGRHFAKQFIRGKPIRFGFKTWLPCPVRSIPRQRFIYRSSVGTRRFSGPFSAEQVDETKLLFLHRQLLHISATS